MKKLLQVTMLIILALTMTVFLGGCKSDLPTPDETSSVEADNQSSTEIEKNIEVDKASLEGKITVAIPAGSYTDFLNNEIIPAFNEEYPNVVVDTIIDENIDTRIAAGDVPNIMAGVFGYMPSKYAKNGFISKL